ncbi:MAG TPA: hypothetical protein VFS95_10220 [Telluria sp.]|jgi:Tfp pilus assembly protein PilO|nr:hypothetical protein [Telluria sp.]
MSEPIYIFTLVVFFGTIVAVFALRYIALTKQAKARLENDDSYRELAARAVQTQAETAISLGAVNATLAELRTRVAGLEKVLKEVE